VCVCVRARTWQTSGRPTSEDSAWRGGNEPSCERANLGGDARAGGEADRPRRSKASRSVHPMQVAGRYKVHKDVTLLKIPV